MTEIPTKWLTVKQAAETYKCFTENSLRGLLMDKYENGLYKCVCKIGGKVLIDIPCFEKWVDSHKLTDEEQCSK